MRLLVLFYLLLLQVHPGICFASDPLPFPPELPHALKMADFEDGEEQDDNNNNLPRDLVALPQLPKEMRSEEEESDDLLLKLANEVDSLNKKLIVQRATDKATQTPRKVKVRGARTVFNYSEDAVFEVMTSVDHITDIALAPGEMITIPPTAGDTVRWTLSVMKSGSGLESVVHLIVKPLEEAIETNLVVATDSHTYHIKLLSTDTHMPAVSWNYPVRPKLDASLLKKENEPILVGIRPESLSFDYEITGDKTPFRPLRVFDDGTKTYIQMPKSIKAGESPALFGVNESDDPILINYRVLGDYYVIDRLLLKFELRVGTSEVVTIEHKVPSLSFWDSLF